MRSWKVSLLALVAMLLPRPAEALVLLSKDGSAKPRGGSVVVLREGPTSVVTLSAKLESKGARVALIWPTTAKLKGQKTLPESPFARLESVTSPRFEEVWEQDPCELHGMVSPPVIPAEALPKAAKSASASPPQNAASFEVRVIEGGADAGLKSLTDGFSVDKLTLQVLGSHLRAGQRLIVAEIETKDLGRSLPALSLELEGGDAMIATRAQAANKSGPLDLYFVAPSTRFEAKNHPNFGVPTNLDLHEGAAANLAGFYGALLGKVSAEEPASVLTEYAWRAMDCEGCSAPLDAGVMAALGVGLLPSAARDQHEVVVDAAAVSDEPGGPELLRKALATCYAKALAEKPGLGGQLTVSIELSGDEVSAAKSKTPGDEALVTCAESALKEADLDRAGDAVVTFSPTSRKFLSELVLTKLRVNAQHGHEKDLVVGGARALEGGREIGPDGKPERRAYFSEAGNNYQPRYVRRHPWKGAIKCQSPQRGVWGPPPKGQSPTKPSKAKVDLAKAVEGEWELAAFKLEASDPPALPAPTPPAAPTDPAPAAPQSSAPTGDAAPPAAGCSCRSEPRGRGVLSGWLVALAIVAGWRRRTSRNHRAR